MKRGFTLMETLIAAAIGLVLLGVTYRLFSAAARYYARGQARADLQAVGLGVLGTLETELRQSAMSTLTTWKPDETSSNPYQTDCAIGFQSPEGFWNTPDLVLFKPTWQFVIYYRDIRPERNTIVRVTCTKLGGGTWRIDPLDLPALCNTVLGNVTFHGTTYSLISVRDVAQNATAFSADASFNTVSLSLTLRRALDSTTSIEERISDTTCLRNVAPPAESTE